MKTASLEIKSDNDAGLQAQNNNSSRMMGKPGEISVETEISRGDVLKSSSVQR
jgi:hypothetical protein